MQSEAAAEDDLLDFLRMPFERKHVDAVLAPVQPQPKISQPSAPERAKVSTEPVASPGPSEESDPVLRILGRAILISLADMPEGPTKDVGVTPSRILTAKIDAADGALRAAPDGGDWMEQSIAASKNVLRTMAGADEKVVGFTDEVLARVEKIESLLGNTNPSAASKTLQQVVSVKVTPPDLTPQDELTAEAVNAIFDTLSNAPSQR